MSVPYSPAYNKTCLQKKRYPDEPVARASTMRHLILNRQLQALYIYRCPICRGWHMTKIEQTGPYQITADSIYTERQCQN